MLGSTMKTRMVCLYDGMIFFFLSEVFASYLPLIVYCITESPVQKSKESKYYRCGM